MDEQDTMYAVKIRGHYKGWHAEAESSAPDLCEALIDVLKMVDRGMFYESENRVRDIAIEVIDAACCFFNECGDVSPVTREVVCERVESLFAAMRGSNDA